MHNLKKERRTQMQKELRQITKEEIKYNTIDKKRRKWLPKTKDNNGNIDIKQGDRNITVASINVNGFKTNNTILI